MLDKNTLDSVYRDMADGGYLDDWVLNCARAMRDQATAANDLAAENERLKAKAKHYVCIRERNRETIDNLKNKLNASESENERLKAKLDAVRELADDIVWSTLWHSGWWVDSIYIKSLKILEIIKDGDET